TMQFDGRKRLKVGDNDPSSRPYPFWINFYTAPPSDKITLQEIEEVIGERLKILQIVDNLLKNLDGGKRNKTFYEVMISQISAVKSDQDKNFYIGGRPNEDTPKVRDARKRDHISHFLLRIYYCQSEELRKWYISRETE